MDRSFLTAALAGALAHAGTPEDASLCVLVWALLWLVTSDPLPGAIERGLEAYRRSYRP